MSDRSKENLRLTERKKNGKKRNLVSTHRENTQKENHGKLSKFPKQRHLNLWKSIGQVQCADFDIPSWSGREISLFSALVYTYIYIMVPFDLSFKLSVCRLAISDLDFPLIFHLSIDYSFTLVYLYYQKVNIKSSERVKQLSVNWSNINGTAVAKIN